ncbi:DUF4209 domain-containing protein [Candidatus Hepatincola sp. Pdp]
MEITINMLNKLSIYLSDSIYLNDIKKKFKSIEDVEIKPLIELLDCLLSMYIDKSDRTQSYKSCFCSLTHRSYNLNDLKKDEAILLFKNIDKINNTILKGRIYDIIWCSKLLKTDKDNNYASVTKAINNYLKHLQGINILPDNQSIEIENTLFRCNNLILSLKQEHKTIFDIAKKYIFSGTENLLLNKECLSILYNFKFSNEEEKEKIAKQFKKNLQNHPNYEIIYDPLLEFYSAKSEEEKRKELHIERANLLEKKGDNEDLPALKVNRYKEAINDWNHIPKSQPKIQELKDKIAIYQKDIILSMPTQAFKIPLNDNFIKVIQNELLGKNFDVVIIKFAKLFITDILKSKILSEKDGFVNSCVYKMGINIVESNYRGKQIHTTKNDDERKRFFIMQNFRCICSMNSEYINIALSYLHLEHNFNWLDIYSTFIHNNPNVPQQHTIVVAKGFYYFLKQDMIEASYLMIPIIEEILRYFISFYENISIINNKSGEEKEKIGIEWFIDKCLAHKIFEDDLAWFLKTTLTQKPNLNLRNDITHGLMHQHYAYSNYHICLLYLIFALVMQPYIVEYEKQKEKG